MAKKPDIGSKEFSLLLESLNHAPHKVYVKRLDSKMFALDLNKVYNYKPERLAFNVVWIYSMKGILAFHQNKEQLGFLVCKYPL